jgi:hypothetical protein
MEFNCAYSPMYGTDVEVVKMHLDSAGAPIYTCKVPLVNSEGKEEVYEILFRRNELANRRTV